MSKDIILNYCPNYNKIINFEFFESDYVSEKLISFYQDYVASVQKNDLEELKKVTKVDTIVSKYIDDYLFRKEMKKELLTIKVRRSVNVLKVIIDNIIKIFDRYEEGVTRNIFISKWI